MKSKSKKSSSNIKHIQVHQDVENPSCFLKLGMAKLHPSIQRGETSIPHHTEIFRHLRSVAQGCGNRGSHCPAGAGWPLAAEQAAMGCGQRPSGGCSSESQQLLRSDRLWRTPAGIPPARPFGAWWSSSGS